MFLYQHCQVDALSLRLCACDLRTAVLIYITTALVSLSYHIISIDPRNLVSSLILI